MLRFYQVAWNPTAKEATVQFKGAAAPSSSTIVGFFEHPGDVDELGYPESHVIYHHVQELLYHKHVENMQEVDILSANVAYVPSTSVSITDQAAVAKGATVQLSLTVAPANATYKTAKWGTDTPALAWVTPDGKLTGLAAGTAKVYAIVDDDIENRRLTKDITITA